jgi:hypothetical protein
VKCEHVIYLADSECEPYDAECPNEAVVRAVSPSLGSSLLSCQEHADECAADRVETWRFEAISGDRPADVPAPG